MQLLSVAAAAIVAVAAAAAAAPAHSASRLMPHSRVEVPALLRSATPPSSAAEPRGRDENLWTIRNTNITTASSRSWMHNLLEFCARWRWAPMVLASVAFGSVALLWTAKCSGSHILGLNTYLKITVFVVNVFLFLSWALLTHATRDKNYSVILFMLVVTVLKLVVSLVLYRLRDGCYRQLLSEAKEYGSSLALFIGPAVLYALSDLLRIGAIQRTDPLTYEVLANLRILLVAIVWQHVVGQRLMAPHCLGITLIAAGCIAKEAGRAWLRENLLTSHLRAGYAELLLLSVFGALASVWNEKLLKHRVEIPLNLQNSVLYVSGLVVLSAMALLPGSAALTNFHSSGLHATPLFDATEWRAILMDPAVMLQALLMACGGVSVGYVLRLLSSIMREVACGVIMILCVPLMWLVFGYPVGVPEALGVVMVLAGLTVLSAFPLPTVRESKTLA